MNPTDTTELEEFNLSLLKKKKKKKRVITNVEEKRDYTYIELLDRLYGKLRQLGEKNPALQSHKRSLPPPKVNRSGAKKTTWSNFGTMCQALQRSLMHVHKFVCAELGTEASLDAKNQLILQGRYLPKHIESLLKTYIKGYITCQMCKSPETTLTRDPVTRLHFLNCESCSSRRSVEPIRSGFHATNRVDRRAAKLAS
jgi:translation initiation factor 2 subunit 2